jgi:hypothetical protein
MRSGWGVIVVGLVLALIVVEPSWSRERGRANDVQEVGSRISKSAFIFLADAQRKVLQPRGQAYLPPGTRFVIFDKTTDLYGTKRRLILTENGLWGYFPEGRGLSWNPDSIAVFKQNNRVAIVERDFEVNIQLGPSEIGGAELNVHFTPSEIYEILSENEDSVKIRLNDRKLGENAKGFTLDVYVPRRNMRVLTKSDYILKQNEIASFRKNILDGVFNLQKPCGTTQITKNSGRGGASVNLRTWFAQANIGGEVERTRISALGEDVNVTRTYYRQHGRNGSHIVTKKQDCSTQKLTYSYRTPGGDEIEINNEIEYQRDRFEFEPGTGRVVVSCSDQWFDLKDYLAARGFSDDEIAFSLSRLARYKNTANARECDANT